jgi:hypothetical protein
MTIEAQNCKVLRVIIGSILVDVMYLHPLGAFVANAARSIMCNEYVGSNIRRNRYARHWRPPSRPEDNWFSMIGFITSIFQQPSTALHALAKEETPSLTFGDFVIYNASLDIAGCTPPYFSWQSFLHTSYRILRRIERTRH